MGSPNVAKRCLDDLRHQRAVDIGQAHVAAIEPVGQPLVIEAQQVQHRRVQVVVRDRLLLGLVAELVAGADHLAALDTRAEHQHRLRAGVVIAADAAL